MLKAFRARCTDVGLLWFALCLYGVEGLIEIVEEQKCHNWEFRLTCRDLDSHIAILEAWYTTLDDYNQEANVTSTHESLKLKTENDSELNRVYVYSSPKHNGVYEPTTTNHSKFENVSVNGTFDFDNTSFVNDSLFFFDDAVDMSVDFMNVSEVCGGVSFSRSYASWREGDKRHRVAPRSASVNLRSPVSYRSDSESSSETVVVCPSKKAKKSTAPANKAGMKIKRAAEESVRCTGVNHCNFLLSEDYPPSLKWVPGVMYIKYACFDDTLSVHYCNREVQVAERGADSEGYIRTPGYPHFYVGDECRWRLRAHPEQRIRVTFLDVSLRSIGPFENECTDYVLVQDSNGDSLLSSCEQVDLPLRLTSITNTVEVMVEAKSKGAYPKRGVLLHYKSIGCVTLPSPSDGYLVYRNVDVAHYMCNVNYVFIDTRQRARLLWCYDDNRWNDTVPLCVEEAAPEAVGNDSATEGRNKDKLPPHEEPNMIVDIVIPSLLIAALFIGNAFIVLIIYKYRKRKTEDLDDEFNTIPLSSNGNVHSAGNAV